MKSGAMRLLVFSLILLMSRVKSASPGVQKRVSANCPPPQDAYELAVAFWSLMWARMTCDGQFQAEADTVDLHAVGNGRCEILMWRSSGDVRFVVSSDAGPASLRAPAALEAFGNGASIRRSSQGGWEEATQRLCLLTSYVGSVPLRRLADVEMVSFAVMSLNSVRSSSRCGSALVPDKSATAPSMRSAVLERALEVRFPLRLCAKEASGPCKQGAPPIVVLAALEIGTAWNRITKSAVRNMRFLGTEPSPCNFSESLSPWYLLAPQFPQGVVGTDTMLEERFPKDYEESKERLRKKSHLLAMAALRSAGISVMPSHFDFRERWPSCAAMPRAQGLCASSWVMAALGAWEKQSCAFSEEGVKNRLSVQYVLDCASNSRGCGGGSVEDAFALLYARGVVDETCSPYHAVPESTMGVSLNGSRSSAEEFHNQQLQEAGSFAIPHGYRLPVRSRQGICDTAELACKAKQKIDSSSCRNFYVRPPTIEEEEVSASTWNPPWSSGIVIGSSMIQAAILAYGAVISIVEVYVDFLDYRSDDAVYFRAHTLHPDDYLGLLAVQLLGWGEAADSLHKYYWIGEASFGNKWGKGGFFLWTRGQDHLGIESRALHPYVPEAYPKGFGGSGSGPGNLVPWVDLLSMLEVQFKTGEARLNEQHISFVFLVVGNVVGVSITLLAVLLACLHTYSGHMFDVPQATGDPRYALVPSEAVD